MAYVSPIGRAQQLTAARIANERSQQIMSQSERIDPLKVRHQELTNQSLEADLKPQPLSPGDKLNIDKNTQEQKVKKAAEFFYNILNSETEERRMSFIASAMDEAIASKDQEKIETSKRFFAAPREDQDTMATAFLQANKFNPEGESGASPPTLVSEALAIFGSINPAAKKWMLQQREKGGSDLSGSAAMWDRVYQLEEAGDPKSVAQARDLRRTLTSGVSQTTEDRVDAAYKIRESERKADLDAIVAEGKEPGTPEYDRIAKRNEGERIKENKVRSQLFEVEDSIELFEELMEGSSPATSGIPQALLSWIPNTENYDFEQMADAAKSRIALGAMDKLKRESQTGSTGFGQLSDKERLLLEKSIRSLETSQSTEAFKKNLNAVLKSYRRMSAMMKLEYAPIEKDLERRVSQMKDLGLTDEDIEIVLVTDGIREPKKENAPTEQVFTGRTATNDAGDILRETEGGGWVE